MKAKASNILRSTNKVFTVVCISSFILAIISFFFLGDIAARHPKGVLDKICLSLALTFIFSLFMTIVLPEGEIEEAPVSEVKKPKKVKKNRKSLQTRIFGRYYSVKHLFFLILGVLCMLYCIISLSFHEIEKFNKIFRICTFAFIFVYLLVYNFLSIIFSKSKKDDSNYDIKGEEEIGMYLIGLLLVGVIALIIWGIIWIGKGIIWLTQYPLVIFGMVVLCMYLLRRNTSKKVK